MMNGRNASGRAVSLLNDDASMGMSLRCDTKLMRWESCANVCISPTGNGSIPPTPELLRSSSWSSRRTLDSASPVTPADADENDNDPDDAPFHKSAARRRLPGARPPTLLPKRSDVSPPSSLLVLHPLERPNSMASPIESPGSVFPPTPASPTLTVASSNTSGSSASSSSAGASMTMVSTKLVPKRYPCQFADTLDCREMFTTSGHASRHAKRHTGEKNVQCPRCPKRFARKDNMKQHLKTHEGGRGADRSNSLVVGLDDASSPTMTSSQLASPVTEMASPYTVAAVAVPAVRPPLRRSSATQHVPRRSSATSSHRLLSPGLVAASPPSPYPSPLFTPGLDALVIAADCYDHDRMTS